LSKQIDFDEKLDEFEPKDILDVELDVNNIDKLANLDEINDLSFLKTVNKATILDTL